ncbi:MAG: CDP-diacylglycerol--serine O-phosphatidyltransferase [Alistipes sp.]|jgi:CDP-diacylglycerol--serine O-phosphatidyltransferase|nr:CDP-diacylglycerol--serine O-phosphatidyltransferase [Alistipes sp.]
MKNRLFTLPNFVTLCNLACGCGATVMALGGRVDVAFGLIAAAAVFDFADGLVARLTGQFSEIGKQLDSLADMVSFGVAPSAVLFTIYGLSPALWGGGFLSGAFGWIVFGVALFSALRLARFNVDEEQREEFTGLPTPAAALAIAALGWMWSRGELFASREMIVAVAVVVSWLLVCPVRMFSLKFKGFGWRGNSLRYIFLAAAAGLLVVWGVGGVAAAIGGYVLIGVVQHFCCGRARNFA